MKKLHSSFLVARVSMALAAVIKHSSDINVSFTEAKRDAKGKIDVVGIVNYNLNLKGFKDFGVTKVSFRFGVELKDCGYHDDEGVFIWHGVNSNTRASMCANNLKFENDHGLVFNKFGDKGFFKTTFYDAASDIDFSECEISTAIVDAAFASLDREDTERYLTGFLQAFNQARGIGIGFDG